MKKLIISIGLASLCAGLWGVRQVRAADNGLEPKFKQSSYVNESVTLKNRYVTLHFFKRITGWGWAEIETPSGKLMAVMGMGIRQGETITVTAEGEDEAAAIEAVEKFLTENV